MQPRIQGVLRRARLSAWGWLLLLLCLVRPGLAALQFDVFLGYDGTVREASWFPVVCEVYNDGPSFNAVFELTSGTALSSDQVRRVPLELPTNTRKRLIIPVFAAAGRFYQWDARLISEKGKVYVERPNLQPKTLAWEGKLLGSLARSYGGAPVLPDTHQNRQDLRPEVARLQVEQFPDNPIALEGLDALYLNSERALSLKVNQVAALLDWVYEGGRLIVAVEQLADVQATPWLQQLLPCELLDLANLDAGTSLQDWIASETTASRPDLTGPRIMNRGGRRFSPQGIAPSEAPQPDPNFGSIPMAVAKVKMRDGHALLSARGEPLLVQAKRGRGELTLLTFNPEREPFRTWKNRSWFWSKLLQVPADWYSNPNLTSWGGYSLDGVFGAMLDTSQVRKLPVEWLLMLLIVYLIVIGPFDQYWLKKINRQMLTWITFPTYVVLFSLLIYFIGYKLRAGETEWNELQIVDVLRSGNKANLRGRTYVSVYSSSNARFRLAFQPTSPDKLEESYACLRGELLDPFRGGQEGSRANVEQYGNLFRADVFVPVWTSLLYVNDWFEPGTLPLTASLSRTAEGARINLENLLNRPLTDLRVVLDGSVFELGKLAAHEKKSWPLWGGTGLPLQSFISQHGFQFQDAVQARRQALGDASRGHLTDLPLDATIASFAQFLPKPDQQRGFVSPPGMDLSPFIQKGDAVVLAWDANQSYAKPINTFSPPRVRRNSLLRLAISAAPTTPAP